MYRNDTQRTSTLPSAGFTADRCRRSRSRAPRAEREVLTTFYCATIWISKTINLQRVYRLREMMQNRSDFQKLGEDMAAHDAKRETVIKQSRGECIAVNDSYNESIPFFQACTSSV